MTKDEALKLAYDETWSAGSEYPIPSFDDVVSFANKLQTIKEALAQPEQEPVLFSCLRCVTPKKCAIHGCGPNTWPSEAPQQRKPLTDEEIDKAMAENKQKLFDTADNYIKMRRAYARIIEAAHGIKGEA